MELKYKEYRTFDKKRNIEKIPKDFQCQDVDFLLDKKRAILALDMGLGKTLIAIIAIIVSGKKALVVCPATLKYNWANEIQPFIDAGFLPEDSFEVVEGKSLVGDKRITIMNYELVKNYHEVTRKTKNHTSILWNKKFDILICDESHYLKNDSSQRSKLIKNLSRKFEYCWLLTGTPLTRKPIELYNLLDICRHELAENYLYYGKRYCDGHQTAFGFDFNGSSNIKELNEKLQTVMSRRKKSDYLDLKEKHRLLNLYKLENPKRIEKTIKEKFNDIRDKIIEAIENENSESPFYNRSLDDGRTLIELMVERQFCSLEKVPYTIELAESILENNEKVVIFCNFLETIDTLEKKFGKSCVKITGSVKGKDRQKAVEEFQSNPNIKVFLGNQAAVDGITLTSGNHVIFNDLFLRAESHWQGEDRCYRMGQEKIVTCYYMIFENTCEEIIYEVLESRRLLFSKAIDGDFGDDKSKKKSFTNEVIEKMKEKKATYEKSDSGYKVKI